MHGEPRDVAEGGGEARQHGGQGLARHARDYQHMVSLPLFNPAETPSLIVLRPPHNPSSAEFFNRAVSDDPNLSIPLSEIFRVYRGWHNLRLSTFKRREKESC